MNTELETGKLYILSGIPASGKSSFLKASSIPHEMILSTDGMRQSMFGSIRYETHSAPRNAGDEAIFEFIKKALRLRAKNKMTTFIDATNLSEGDRQSWAMIAIEEGMKSEVLFSKQPLKKLSPATRCESTGLARLLSMKCTHRLT